MSREPATAKKIQASVPIRRVETSLARVDRQPGRDGKPGAEEAIRRHAYELWEAAGRPQGDGVGFWLDAERELAPRN